MVGKIQNVEEAMEGARVGLARTSWWGVLVLGVALAASPGLAQTIHQAVLGESDQRTAEVSTEDLWRILAEGTAMVLDVRPFLEYAVSHIPGARNVSAKPGVPMSMYVSDVAEIGRLVGGDKTRPLFALLHRAVLRKEQALRGGIADSRIH